MTYQDKLKDPRWQKLRLEVLALHRWQCDTCSSARDENIPLAVHHRYYDLREEDGKLVRAEPWDYPIDAFSVLCDPCHIQAEIALMEIRKALASFEYFRISALAQDLQQALTRDNPVAVLNMLSFCLGSIKKEAA